LDSIIKKGKDRLDARQNTDIVYKIECINCDQVYIDKKTFRDTDKRTQKQYK